MQTRHGRPALRDREVGTIAATLLSIQERLYPEFTCFGCGMANPLGLHIRSYPDDGFVVAQFVPRPELENGMGFVCGGIIATALDCHSAAAVMLEAERRGWVPRGDATVPYVTAGIDVHYLRPTPIAETSLLRAAVVSSDDAQMTVDVELLCDDKVRSRATAVWKAWRPRH